MTSLGTKTLTYLCPNINMVASVQGFDCRELLYTDYKQLPAKLEKSLNCRYVPDVAEMVKQCDIVTINAPLHKVRCEHQ